MKKKIDKYFTENYDYLVELAESAINNSGRPYDATELVNYSYERALTMCKYGNVADCVCNIILKDCYWNNSYINRELLLNQSPFQGTEDIEVSPVESLFDEIEDKILLEKWYNDRRSILELYRIKLTKDKAKLVLLDKMIELKTKNHRVLGDLYDIPHTSMYLMIKEIKEGLKDLEKQINKYDNKNVNNR